MARKILMGLDFDGTLVKHEYPEIGEDIGAFPWLHRFADKSKFILFTCRSGDALDQAVAHIEAQDIVLYGINKTPGQWRWSRSPKAYCNIYIDDAFLGAPLEYPVEGRRYINWAMAGAMLIPIVENFK